MLNKRERYQVLQCLRIYCKVGPLPFDVDLATWELKESSTGKKWICFVSYICFVLHVIYKCGSLLYAYLFVADFQLHQLIIHIIAAMSSVMVAFWYQVMCWRSPVLFAKFAKMTLLGKVEGTDMDQSDELEKHWRARLREYSLQDLIAANLSYMNVFCAVLIVTTYVYDPSMRLLLYSALPSRLQNWATFGLCLLEEIRFLLVILATGGPMLLLHIISFELICTQIRLTIRKIENGTQNRRSVYTFLRCLQLYMTTFNNINAYLIFTFKFLSILISIVSGYAAIAHFWEHPVFGCMYYVTCLDIMMIYSVIYQKAFRIPQLLDRTVGCARLHMDGNRFSPFGRQMRSIPPTGVRVGHFHMMERASTLIFMNYVVVNIVNMLVAYG